MFSHPWQSEITLFISIFDDLLFCMMSYLTFPVLSGRRDHKVNLNSVVLGHLLYSWNLTSGFCLNSFLTSTLYRLYNINTIILYFFLCAFFIFGFFWMRLLHVYNIQGRDDVFHAINKENIFSVFLYRALY